MNCIIPLGVDAVIFLAAAGFGFGLYLGIWVIRKGYVQREDKPYVKLETP